MAFSQIVADLRAAGFTYATIGELVGTYPRQVQRWHDGDHQPRKPYQLKLHALHYIVTGLGETMTPEQVAAWFHRPCRDLAGIAPIVALHAGRTRAVIRVVDGMSEVSA